MVRARLAHAALPAVLPVDEVVAGRAKRRVDEESRLFEDRGLRDIAVQMFYVRLLTVNHIVRAEFVYFNLLTCLLISLEGF